MNQRVLLAFALLGFALLAFAPEVSGKGGGSCCLPQRVDGQFMCDDCKPPDFAFCGKRGKKGCDNLGCNCDGGCIVNKGKKCAGSKKGKSRSDDEGMMGSFINKIRDELAMYFMPEDRLEEEKKLLKSEMKHA